MYIAMNRFRIAPGRGADFEALWANRESFLHEVPGFAGFHLLKGPEHDDHTLYASHTVWESEEHFIGWTKFRGIPQSSCQCRCGLHKGPLSRTAAI